MNMIGICKESAWNMHRISKEYAWNMHEYVWNMQGIAWNMYEYAWNMYGMVQVWHNSGLIASNTLPKSVPNLPPVLQTNENELRACRRPAGNASLRAPRLFGFAGAWMHTEYVWNTPGICM